MTILANPTMVCSYGSSCINLTVALVYCQTEVCALRLYHVFQGEYVDMHEIGFYGVERKIFCDCVDKLWMVCKPEKLKNVVQNNVNRTEKPEENK